MGDEGRRPFPDEEGDAPYAASVRRRDPGDDSMPDRERAARAGVDYADELDGPPQYGPGARRIDTGAMDAAALKERLAAPPMQRPAVTCEERDNLVAACAEAVAAWSGIYGGTDLAIRALADAIGSSVEEAERLLTAELARRSKG